MAAVSVRKSQRGQGRMQAQFKDMERQNAELRGGSVDIRKHRQQIHKLRKMNNIIKQELATETRLAAVNNSSTAAAKLAKLREQKERYETKIETERLRIDELETQITEMTKQIIAKKRVIGGEKRAVENHRQIVKKITILENQLDKAKQRYNGQQTSNGKLRTQIENLRKDRLMMDKLEERLKRELSSKKDQMQGIIETAEEAYRAREKAQDHIAKLKTSAEAEQTQFLMEWEQLGGMVEHDRTQKHGFATGFAEADDKSEVQDVEEFLRKKIVQTHWAIALDKAKQQVSLNKVKKYEGAFGRIKDVTGITEVDLLVSSFIAAEESTYSFFNVVNDLSRDIEKVEKELQEINNEMAKIHQAAQEDSSSSRLNALQSLETKLTKANAKTQHFEEKYEAVNSTLAELTPGIRQIFDGLGCAEMDEAAELLREHPDGVSEINMDQFLTLIESRAIEKLNKYARKRAAELQWSVDELLVARPFTDAATKGNWDIVPPTIADEESVVDEDDEDGLNGVVRPLTRGEMRSLAKKSVEKVSAALVSHAAQFSSPRN